MESLDHHRDDLRRTELLFKKISIGKEKSFEIFLRDFLHEWLGARDPLGFQMGPHLFRSPSFRQRHAHARRPLAKFLVYPPCTVFGRQEVYARLNPPGMTVNFHPKQQGPGMPNQPLALEF